MTVLEQAYAIREAMDIAGATLTDEKALECVRLYKPWEVDKDYDVGDFLTYGVNGVGDPQLYKVAQVHTSQEDWMPDETPALYTRIDETHAGTEDDPIPYNGNMELVAGLYYSQNDVVYLCTRGTGQPVHHDLADLVGLYVEEVKEE